MMEEMLMERLLWGYTIKAKLTGLLLAHHPFPYVVPSWEESAGRVLTRVAVCPTKKVVGEGVEVGVEVPV
jgi:hypothetical protein